MRISEVIMCAGAPSSNLLGHLKNSKKTHVLGILKAKRTEACNNIREVSRDQIIQIL